MLLGLAAVLALMLMLLLLAAIGFGPERPRSLGPIPTPPSFEAKVGDSVPLPAPRLASVSQGVAVRGAGLSSARPVSLAADKGGGSGEAIALAPAQAVGAGGTVPPKPIQPSPEAGSAPAPAPAPVPVAAPIPSGGSAEGGGRSGPIAAGVIPPAEEGEGEEAICEGTEYTVTVAFDAEAIFGGATDAEIHLRRVGSDGSEVEMQAEGGIDDLVALFEQFASEGECVTVVVEPLSGEDGGETEAEEPEADPVVP